MAECAVPTLGSSSCLACLARPNVAMDPKMRNSTAEPMEMIWLTLWLVLHRNSESWRAASETTAEAIASTRAMIDFHGRVLRLTRATRSERSTCLSCTRGTSLRTIRPNAIRPEAGGAGGGTTSRDREKRWGPGHIGPDPSAYAIGMST